MMKDLVQSRFKLGTECPRKLFYEAYADRHVNRRQEDAFLAALA